MKLSLKLFFVFASASLLFADQKVSKDAPPSTSNARVTVIVQYRTPPTQYELNWLDSDASGNWGNIQNSNGQWNGQGNNGQGNNGQGNNGQGNFNGQGSSNGQWNSGQGNHNVKANNNHVRTVTATILASKIPQLEQDPNVKYVSPDRPTSKFLDITTATVNANIAWNMALDGTGIGVAIIDSGIYAHADLSTSSGGGSRIVYSQSFVPGLDASDQFGHGTHVAGIVASNGKDSKGVGFTRTLPWNCPQCKPDRPSGAGCEWRGHRQRRDRGDQSGHRSSKHLQHPRHQSFAGPSGVRILYGRPAVPGRGSRVAGGDRGGHGGRQLWTRERKKHAGIRHHCARPATIRT